MTRTGQNDYMPARYLGPRKPRCYTPTRFTFNYIASPFVFGQVQPDWPRGRRRLTITTYESYQIIPSVSQTQEFARLPDKIDVM